MSNLQRKHYIARFFFILLLFPPVLSAQTLIVGSEPDYPPFCMVDDKGKAVGFSVDLFRASAKAAGMEVEFQVRPWKILLEELGSGKIDALPLVGKSPEREEILDFSFPYNTLHGAVFVREGENSIHTLEDLADKEIIVMAGDNADEYATRKELSPNIIRTDSFNIAFRILQSGSHDAVIAQKLMGVHLLEQLNIDSIKPLEIDLPDFTQEFCFAVTKGNAQLQKKLNEGLLQTIADGTYARIYSYWFSPVSWEDFPLWKKLSSFGWIIVSVILLVLLASILYLQIQIKRKTRSLREEISIRTKTENQLQKLVNEKELLLKEVHHRIKNNFAAAESLLMLQSAEISNPEAKSALMETMGRLSTMRVLYEKMLLTDDYRDTSTRVYLTNLADEIIKLYQGSIKITLVKNMDNIILGPDKLFPLGIILNELLTNCLKYAYIGQSEGLITVNLQVKSDSLILQVIDEGGGLAANYNLDKQSGFGLSMVQMLAEQLHGKFSISSNSSGTTAEVIVSLN